MAASRPQPPRRPVTYRAFGEERVDNYAWMRDRTDPEVQLHLEAENSYTESKMAQLGDLQDRLYREILGHVQETDSSALIPHGPYFYYRRTEKGKEHPIICRVRRDGSKEEVVLDVNLLATGHEYCRVGEYQVSPSHNLLAYTLDTNGSERFQLRVRDLRGGSDVDWVDDVYYGIAWLDDEHLIFTRPDAAMRPYQVWRHKIGAAGDQLVQQEHDERFFAHVHRSRSQRYVLVQWESNSTDEIWLLSTNDVEQEPQCVLPRRQGTEATIADWKEWLFILINDGGPNFRLVKAPLSSPAPENWIEVLPHDPESLREGLDLFERFCVIYERGGAATSIRVLDLIQDKEHRIDPPEAVCHISPGENYEWQSQELYYECSSLVTPPTTIAYGMRTKQTEVIKVQPVPRYEPQSYCTERIWARADDGQQIPLSLVYRRDLKRDGSAPCLLRGYGAYGISSDPKFSITQLPLLERGFVLAIAHIRGGSEMGRKWYLAGKLGSKMNTFTDFCACADALVASGYTSHSKLAIRGGSAGGLLIGAVVNLRPDLARVAVAQVPFVDVLSTMLDETLPLTATEWEEWGDPRTESGYVDIRHYSPYDNVAAAAYPAILATSGLNDPRVSFWEPAKWVAKLRDLNTSGRDIFLKMEMEAGHGGVSGRYRSWYDEAQVLAFILDQLGAGD